MKSFAVSALVLSCLGAAWFASSRDNARLPDAGAAQPPGPFERGIEEAAKPLSVSQQAPLFSAQGRVPTSVTPPPPRARSSTVAGPPDGKTKDQECSLVRELRLELERCRAEDGTPTPYDEFLLSLEAEDTTAEEREMVQELLEQWPIQLSPGEAAWVLDRVRLDDWLSWGPNLTVAFLTFLGVDRIVRELPEEKLRELVEWYETEKEWEAELGAGTFPSKLAGK